MPVDPQIQALLDMRATLPAIQTLSVVAARALAPPKEIPGVRRPHVASVVDRDMQGPNGSIALRRYTPVGQGPFPLTVFFHGGGFVICGLDSHDAMCRNLCAGTGSVVVSVDYRLAPEHKFPAAPDDCLAATRWVAENAAALGGDPSRIIVAGDSAGGTLATVIALRIRDEGGPRLIGQMLIYPGTVYHMPPMPSMLENATGYGVTRDAIIWFWDHYTRSPADGLHPNASPLRAATLAGLPPALVITAEYDPLRDEGEAYAEALRKVEVPVESKRWDGMNHAFFFFPGLVDKATQALDEACAWARRIFAA